MPDHLFETFKSNSAKVTDFEDFKSLGNLKIFENTNENSKKFQNFEKIKLSKKLTKEKLKGPNGSHCKISGNTNHTKKIHLEKINCDSGLITIPETGKLEPFNNFRLDLSPTQFFQEHSNNKNDSNSVEKNSLISEKTRSLPISETDVFLPPEPPASPIIRAVSEINDFKIFENLTRDLNDHNISLENDDNTNSDLDEIKNLRKSIKAFTDKPLQKYHNNCFDIQNCSASEIKNWFNSEGHTKVIVGQKCYFLEKILTLKF